MRTDAIREEALTVGAQTALHFRTKFLRELIEEYGQQYDRIFSFNSLLLSQKKVMPPIITEMNDVVLLDGSDVMRIADKNYHIIKQARFVSNPPTWRDYLIRGIYRLPKKSNRLLLPKNAAERELWVTYVRRGWALGIEQADEIMTTNMFELHRDWVGSIRYHMLKLKGQVSEPYIADSTKSVSGSGQDMIISDRVLRITVKPTLSLNPESWQALPKLPSALQAY